VNLSLGELGVFLFAMFRPRPKASELNSKLYRTENNLSHLVRTQEFIDKIERNIEPTDESEPVLDEIRTIEFDDVRFSYGGRETEAISGVSFKFKKGEFVSFVGQAGAGNSIASRSV
jgi:subfamily B ATP-binding cassette protein MsbA